MHVLVRIELWRILMHFQVLQKCHQLKLCVPSMCSIRKNLQSDACLFMFVRGCCFCCLCAHLLSFRSLKAAMIDVFRVPEGRAIEDSKSIPVSIFMKRIRSVPFPRTSLPESAQQTVVEDDDDADEGDE